MDCYSKSKTYLQPRGVMRDTGITFERWRGGVWVEERELLYRSSGMDGDGSDYVKITEAEANKIIDELRKLP